MNTSFSFCRIVKSLACLCAYVSTVFLLNCNGQSNVAWILKAERTLENLAEELDRRCLYVAKEEIINVSLAELGRENMIDENVRQDLQFVIENLTDYRLLVDRRRDPFNSPEFVRQFNPIIAYIDGTDQNRGYCSALHLDGSVAIFSRSSLPELIEQSKSILREAKGESKVQEYPVNNLDSED